MLDTDLVTDGVTDGDTVAVAVLDGDGVMVGVLVVVGVGDGDGDVDASMHVEMVMLPMPPPAPPTPGPATILSGHSPAAASRFLKSSVLRRYMASCAGASHVFALPVGPTACDVVVRISGW